MRKLVEQVAGNRNSDRSDGVRIMPLGTNATPEGGSPAATAGLVIQDFRPGLRGKNGSARRSGTHRLRCRVWRDGETPPASAFIVTQAQFLLQFFGVTLNDPAMFRHLDESFQIRLER